MNKVHYNQLIFPLVQYSPPLPRPHCAGTQPLIQAQGFYAGRLGIRPRFIRATPPLEVRNISK